MHKKIVEKLSKLSDDMLEYLLYVATDGQVIPVEYNGISRDDLEGYLTRELGLRDLD